MLEGISLQWDQLTVCLGVAGDEACQYRQKRLEARRFLRERFNGELRSFQYLERQCAARNREWDADGEMVV